MRKSPWQRLVDKREISESGCILWTGSVDGGGYGQTRVNGKLTQVHRIAWEELNGEIPEGLFVLHRCDVRRCMNINHLFLGTHSDNMRDMKKKGRSLHRYGSANPRAKLNNELAQYIRKQYFAGIAQTVLAKELCIGRSTIGRVCRSENWK